MWLRHAPGLIDYMFIFVIGHRLKVRGSVTYHRNFWSQKNPNPSFIIHHRLFSIIDIEFHVVVVSSHDRERLLSGVWTDTDGCGSRLQRQAAARRGF